jgi:hypothetical protein
MTASVGDETDSSAASFSTDIKLMLAFRLRDVSQGEGAGKLTLSRPRECYVYSLLI